MDFETGSIKRNKNIYKQYTHDEVPVACSYQVIMIITRSEAQYLSFLSGPNLGLLAEL